VFDQRVIDVGPIGQTHLGKDVSRPIAAVRLEKDFLPKHHCGRRLLGLMAVRLTLLRAVDATQTDTFRVLLVQDVKSIAVKDGDDEAGVICRKSSTGEKEVKKCDQDNKHRTSC
ncbi:MAG TPA: hypothetical protein VFV44_05060, partial [Nitrospiraceae bacterium]|nr:hypothetical protein [Nitrospiraceae bacterium]